MKLRALHDDRGVILAAVVVDPDAPGSAPRPVATEGTRVSELTISQEHADLALDELCTRLRVDVERAALVEAERGDAD
jgi:hypothetical protein